MDREIISRLKQRICDAGVDAIVAISPENVTYVSGFVVPSQSLMRWRHAAVIVTADGRVSMVAIDMEATTVRAHAGIDDLRIYREFSDDPMDNLAESLRDLRLERGKIAVGEGQHDDVARLLPEIDRLDQVVKARRAGLEQMHRSPGQSRLDRAAV